MALKSLKEITIKEITKYWRTCNQKCTEGKHCPFHTGGSCILDFTGMKCPDDIENWRLFLDEDFDENMTVGEFVEMLFEKRSQLWMPDK